MTGAHVVVTGGASGIGRALVERFASAGARAIVVADVDGVGAKSVASSVASDDVETLAVTCDWNAKSSTRISAVNANT